MRARLHIPDIVNPSHVNPVPYSVFVSFSARHPPDHRSLTVAVVVVNGKAERLKHTYMYTRVTEHFQRILKPENRGRNFRYVHSDVQKTSLHRHRHRNLRRAPYSCLRYSVFGFRDSRERSHIIQTQARARARIRRWRWRRRERIRVPVIVVVRCLVLAVVLQVDVSGRCCATCVV